MSIAVVIPARFASTRLPGKPLLRETGKYLIQHVYESAVRAKSATHVIVATDDDRIADAVRGFGGRVAMTDPDHPSGTDRVAEVARSIDADVIVNIQGDEPQFDPAGVDQLVHLLATDPAADVATLATPIRTPVIYRDPNCVKVVFDDNGRALYFSRSPIPYCRDGEPEWNRPQPFAYLHVGVYAYRREALFRMARSEPHPIERAEKLEQLRVMGQGGIIRVGVIPKAHRGVDTPADYALFVRDCRNGREFAMAA
jgi:3-deoxy-manno-octulosonate cytidylyltransferase (CMP-KDO synthetase)